MRELRTREDPMHADSLVPNLRSLKSAGSLLNGQGKAPAVYHGSVDADSIANVMGIFNPISRIDHLESKVDLILGQIHGVNLQQRPEVSPNESQRSGESQGLDALDVIGRGIVGSAEADVLLGYWQREVAPGFPFVVIPDNATVEDLRSEKPFLLLSVLFMTSYQDIALNAALDEVIKSYVGGTVAQGTWNRDNSHDLLQGLLVIIAGSKTLIHLTRLGYYRQLAVAVIYELRIDRAPKIRSLESRINIVEDVDSPRTLQGIANAESRLLIGFYVIQSILATSGIAQGSGFHGELDRHVHAFRAEVEEYKAQLPFPINADYLIAAQYCALELHLCHISLFDPDPNTASTSDSLLVSKIDTLCHGLAAANQFFDYYAETTPLGQERGFTYVQWMQTGLIIAVACKLTLAALDPSLRQNTHLQKLREALDFAGRLRLFQMRLTHIDRPDTSLPEHKRKHAPSHYENWLNCVAEWFEGKYRAALADPMAGITSTMSNPMEDSQYADGSVDAGAQLDQNLFWMELQDMSIEEILSWMGPMDFAA
ncbi:hypothetical protein N7468_004960 [Penicillium chermesinum]|uniref:Transcription factor domain-containing protein n=1 Tax=Penicillium chermesinum TaxID=63820 RepID=A0A9W9NYA5_9EURO|nr:uncharacterized protein N7468_004960 [Penicillium chermesinum]KAJ5232004.1 hypothetical protein N7468_004960 [Penicillium chermesinum]